jgi:hypothetical protein
MKLYSSSAIALLIAGIGASPASAVLTYGPFNVSPGTTSINVSFDYLFSHGKSNKENSWTYDVENVDGGWFPVNLKGVLTGLGPNSAELEDTIIDDLEHGSVANFKIDIFQRKTTFGQNQVKVQYGTDISAMCIARKPECGPIKSTLSLTVGSTDWQAIVRPNPSIFKTSEVPGPFPLLGVAAFLARSRKLRKACGLARTPQPATI